MLVITRVGQGEKARLEDVGLLQVDLGRWHPQWSEDGPRPRSPLAAVWGALRKEWPELRRLLQRRAAELRKLGPEIARLSGHCPGGTSAAVKRVVGRNDPCPCGSRKKHKKCCGA